MAGWKTIDEVGRFYFMERVGDFDVAFFSDHAGDDGLWHTTNGEPRGERERYPYRKEDYEAVSRQLSESGRPVITVSHYALEGGNRGSALLSQVLPLPDRARLHIHGHAHIGDAKWAGAQCHQKISWVAQQNIPQVNVSSLENRRGSGIRSVFLEIYEDQRLGIFFRNHQLQKWEEVLKV